MNRRRNPGDRSADLKPPNPLDPPEAPDPPASLEPPGRLEPREALRSLAMTSGSHNEGTGKVCSGMSMPEMPSGRDPAHRPAPAGPTRPEGAGAVAVVTDSASNLPPEIAGELGVLTVPLYLRLGQEVFRDGLDMTPQDFYRRLTRDGAAVSTSAPSPGDFLEAYRRTGAQEIVCVTVASTMSAAHHEAVIASRTFPGRVEVVDSLSASMAEGFVAAEAARTARAGGTLVEVVARARAVAAGSALLATVETFEFLKRSGRVGALQAYAATMLDIKPVFRFQHGGASAVARPRTRKRALGRVLSEALHAIGDRPAHVAAFHAAAADDAMELLARLEEGAHVVERVVVEVTPVIGVHTGPGLAGVALFTEGSGFAPGGPVLP